MASFFFYKLLPPRPTFPQDMTEAEQRAMQEHFGYWRRLMAEGSVVAYGPVMDPHGTFGMAILEVEDVGRALTVAENDPAVKSQCGFDFEVHPMPDALVRQ
jgi:uncharacterized protein YciI